MELVHDAVSEAQYERCSQVFNGELARGVTPRQILDGCIDGANNAEKLLDRPEISEFDRRKLRERVEDFTLIGSWARARIDYHRDGAEQGHQISNRMAAEREQRRAHIETSNDIRQGMKDLGIRPGPPHAVMMERRYGPNWRKRVGRQPGRDGL